MDHRADMVSRKVGKAGLIGMRPRYSQILKTMTTDRSLKVNGCEKKERIDVPGNYD
jgi:hypothetical protein